MDLLEQSIINILNNWRHNLSEEEPDCVKYEFTKNKFKNKYLERTGESLKITKKLESILFSKIASGLSKNYEVTEELLDKYLDFSFDNFDFFVHKFGGFNLNNIASFSSEWKEDFLKFDFEPQIVSEIDLSNGIFEALEKHGVPLVAKKIFEDKKCNPTELEKTIIEKLNTLTKTKDGLSKLKNMLRKTVENEGEYTILKDYKLRLCGLFKYFSGEPWAK